MSPLHRTPTVLWRLNRQASIPAVDIPAFLCPGLLSIARPRATRSCFKPSQLSSLYPQRRFSSLTTPDVSPTAPTELQTSQDRAKLPLQCSGCGAISQTVLEGVPGYYTTTRKSVIPWIQSAKESPEDVIIKEALKNAHELAGCLDLGDFSKPHKNVEEPVCDRCQQLKHNRTGESIEHPSLPSIQETIFESPHKYNHVYHIIDAADFPMSLVPGLHKLLHLTPQRSLNRRSKTGKFYHGRKTEVSFIITRSDLLAPLKQQVDSMLPYLREVLRDALGRSGKDVRLGNVRCVSAKRSWWVKELKEEIWNRGGGGWLVGKVNVGKSQLFSDVFPKGRQDHIKQPLTDGAMTVNRAREILSHDDHSSLPAQNIQESEYNEGEHEGELQAPEPLDTSSLLPPAPKEVKYPVMPLVSILPGTTASPIRLPFGNGKGELIDLPGLSRGDLELHVQPAHRSSLVMRSRVIPKQQVIKPGKSLLIGGFIRITPTTPDVIILAYSFTPIDPHLTSTEKAIGTQTLTRESKVENISLPTTAEKIASAGTFRLKWDVTRERSGPLTRNDAVGLKVDRLPFRVLATDILIEGCGWVELVAQVRKPHFKNTARQEIAKDEERDTSEPGKELFATEETGSQEYIHQEVDPSWPTVEVFSPEGKFIGARRPMNAWLLAQKPAKGKLQGRPRKSMKGAKKAEKLVKRNSQL